MTRSSQIILAAIGVVVLALVGGYVGAGLRGDSSTSESTSDASATPFLDGIKDRGKLRVCVPEAPPMSSTQNGADGGPSVLPLKNLAKSLKVDFETQAVEWSGIVAAVQAGHCDFADNLDVTTERALSIKFSEPIFSYECVFVVPASSPYKTAPTLFKGGKIGTLTGTAANPTMKSQGADLQEFQAFNDLVSAIQSKRVVGAFYDIVSGAAVASFVPGTKVLVPNPPIYSAASAYGVPADTDERSLEIVNTQIQNTKESGELDRAFATAKAIVDPSKLGSLAL